MRRGLHWPYDTPGGAPEETWRLLELAQPELIVIPSHAPESDYQGILDRCPDLLWVIRAKTGPGHLGAWPEELLDYREWETERSLSESIQWCLDRGIVPWVTLGCEPDIELAREPVDEPAHTSQAIHFYVPWALQQLQAIRDRFGGVPAVAAAALSQGSETRFAQWAAALAPVWEQMDWLAEHCYTNGQALDNLNWGGRWRWLQRYGPPGKPIILTEVNDNGIVWEVLGPAARAAHLGQYASALLTAGERFPELLGAAGFTLPGGAQDASKPPWWFWTDADVEHWRDAQAAVAPPEPPLPLGEGGGEGEQPPPDLALPPDADPPLEEPPLEEPPPEPLTLEQALAAAELERWWLIHPGLPFNPESACVKGWRLHPAVGSPIAPEMAGEGWAVQACANDVLVWRGDTETARPRGDTGDVG